MAYSDARALAKAIHHSAADGIRHTALSEFFAQRLIARLATAFPDQWALKGGHAMVARLPDVARTTNDIDGALASTSRETAIVELEQAAKASPADPDFLDFGLVKSKPGYVEDLASLSFRVRFGGKVHGNVKLDVQVVRERRELGELVPLGRRVNPPKQGGWPDQVRVAPVPEHMAEKLVALYSVHNGRVSSRGRDVVDLALLARYAPPEPRDLESALGRALARPTAPSVSVDLPAQFVVPERFRSDFEQEPHGLSWDASMQEIAAVSMPALERHSRDSPRPGGNTAEPSSAPREGTGVGSTGESDAENASGAVYVRPHSRGGHAVPGHWRAAPHHGGDA